jgi:hypothetical protein
MTRTVKSISTKEDPLDKLNERVLRRSLCPKFKEIPKQTKFKSPSSFQVHPHTFPAPLRHTITKERYHLGQKTLLLDLLSQRSPIEQSVAPPDLLSYPKHGNW